MYTERRILAIDYGEKRIGLAVSDPLNLFATGLPTLHVDGSFLSKLRAIIKEKHVVEIVVGLPLTLRGEQSRIAEQVREFARSLGQELALPVKLWDERFTSSMACRTLIDLGVKKKKRQHKPNVDELAAIHLLQSYLAARTRR